MREGKSVIRIFGRNPANRINKTIVWRTNRTRHDPQTSIWQGKPWMNSKMEMIAEISMTNGPKR